MLCHKLEKKLGELSRETQSEFRVFIDRPMSGTESILTGIELP